MLQVYQQGAFAHSQGPQHDPQAAEVLTSTSTQQVPTKAAAAAAPTAETVMHPDSSQSQRAGPWSEYEDGSSTQSPAGSNPHQQSTAYAAATQLQEQALSENTAHSEHDDGVSDLQHHQQGEAPQAGSRVISANQASSFAFKGVPQAGDSLDSAQCTPGSSSAVFTPSRNGQASNKQGVAVSGSRQEWNTGKYPAVQAGRELAQVRLMVDMECINRNHSSVLCTCCSWLFVLLQLHNILLVRMACQLSADIVS